MEIRINFKAFACQRAIVPMMKKDERKSVRDYASEGITQATGKWITILRIMMPLLLPSLRLVLPALDDVE